VDEHEGLDVRISDTGEIAAGLPYLLGFPPVESVVLIGLGGVSGGAVGLTVRADLPPPEHAAPLAGELTRTVATGGPGSVLLVVVTEAPDVPGWQGEPDLPQRDLVRELVTALSACGIGVGDALLVRRGRWWSYDCPHPCCDPAEGTPLPAGVSALAAASVLSGQVVVRDRAELGARLDRISAEDWSEVRAACLAGAAARAARAGEAGRRVVQEEDWQAVLGAVASRRPGGPAATALLPAEELARVLWALGHTAVRDRALGLALGADAAAAEALWTECTRRAPCPLDAPPATLLAVSAWLRGDGAMAGIALDHALLSDEDYELARLLAAGLARCVRPDELRTLITDTLRRLDETAAAG
jgi:Domain of unknown function (DUF4192)